MYQVLFVFNQVLVWDRGAIAAMNEYDFTLKFNFQNPQIDPNDYSEQLHESSCDDALIGIGKNGCIALNFVREASSACEAISSAISDVKKVIPHAILIEATSYTDFKF